MKIFLCFALTTLVVSVTDGAKIKIQIDSDDLINIFEGVMYSEVLQKFASELARRRDSKKPLNNPYHPEDELLDHFNTDIDKEIEYVSPSNDKLDFLSDTLENDNDKFLNGNDVESEDILTDNDKPKNKLIIIRNSNSTINATAENNVMKKKIFDAVNNISIPLKKDENISIPLKKKYNISIPLKKDDNINTPPKEYGYTGKPPKKEDIKIFKEDRAYFKPVQRRFVLKSANEDISIPDENIIMKRTKYNAVHNIRISPTKDENISTPFKKNDNVNTPPKEYGYTSKASKKEDIKIFKEDRGDFKPVQRRFQVIKSSNDDISIPDENIMMKRRKYNAVHSIRRSPKKDENISTPFKKNDNVNTPPKEYGYTSISSKKEDIKIFKEDRGNFKPVQRRFQVIKSSNDDISAPNGNIMMNKTKYNAVNNMRIPTKKDDISMSPKKDDNINTPPKEYGYISIPPKKEDIKIFKEDRA